MKNTTVDTETFVWGSRLIYLPFISFCLMLCSCKCCYIIGECINTPESGAIFSIVDQNTSDNLLDGPSKRYELEDIKIYSDRDTFMLNRGIDTLNRTSLGLVLYADYLIDEKKLYYISFGNNDIDTLVTDLNEFQNDCCKTVVELKAIKHNGFPFQSCGQNVVLLRK